MSSQRYERVAEIDTNDHATTHSPTTALPNSPPPSFRSRASSLRASRDDDTSQSEEERNMHDAFDAPSDDEEGDEDTRDQQRLIPRRRSRSQSPSGNEESRNGQRRPAASPRRNTELPAFTPAAAPSGRVMGGGSNDGVFANLSAKPRAGEDLEEKPPTYEQAAADATPPYWETTVLSPYATSGNPDDVFVDGLLVGSFFSFIWNGLISMSFQIPGFLLTYLLHTTHAAKHGSRVGLGITLVQYGFQMRYSSSPVSTDPGSPSGPVDGVPDDPNAHDFDPSQIAGGTAGGVMSGHGPADWLSYVLMIVGWFILIRGVSDFLRARRQEALVRSSPDRGLGVAVIAEGEDPESSV